MAPSKKSDIYFRRKDMAERDYGLSLSDKINVCENCCQASCLLGMFKCEKHRESGVAIKSVAFLLIETGEHPTYWDKSKAK